MTGSQTAEGVSSAAVFASISSLFSGQPGTSALPVNQHIDPLVNPPAVQPAVAEVLDSDDDLFAAAFLSLTHLLACDFDAGATMAKAAATQVHSRHSATARDLIRAVTDWATAVTGEPSPVADKQSEHTLDNEIEVLTSFLTAEAAMSRGDLATAEDLARIGVDSAATPGLMQFLLQLTLCRALLFQGRVTEAATVGAQLKEFAADLDDDLAIGLAAATSGFVHATAGSKAEALTEVELALSKVEGYPEVSYFHCGVSTLSAFALSAAGEPVGAAAVLVNSSGGPNLPRIQAVDRAFGFEMLTAAALAAGDVEAAAEWVQRGAALAAGWHGDPAGMTRCALDRAAALLASHLGAHLQSVELAENAVRAAAGAGGSLEVARALLIAGAAQAGLGDRSDAIASFERAADISGELGAHPVLGQAAKQLRGFGRRVPPLPGAGFAGLSEREAAVAVQLAAGRANQQIADSLHLSVRTVQAHVTRVLRAFGVHSRWAVAAAISAQAAIEPVDPALGREPLAGRQSQVASLTALGWSNGRIGAELSISVKTVEKYLTQVYDKWHISSRAECAALIHPAPGQTQARPISPAAAPTSAVNATGSPGR